MNSQMSAKRQFNSDNSIGLSSYNTQLEENQIAVIYVMVPDEATVSTVKNMMQAALGRRKDHQRAIMKWFLNPNKTGASLQWNVRFPLENEWFLINQISLSIQLTHSSNHLR